VCLSLSLPIFTPESPLSAATLRQILPYLLLLLLAGVTFIAAGRIGYTPRASQLGPDVWPKMAAGLIVAVSLYELIKAFIARGEAVRGIAEALDTESGAADASPSYPGLLAAGLVLTALYGALVPVLGFLVASFLYLASFMYVGRYRAHGVIWVSSALGTLLFGLIFLKLVYVSLPRGIPPFDRVTDLVTNMF
jgi:putative tricarboxylic transport membrane protein